MDAVRGAETARGCRRWTGSMASRSRATARSGTRPNQIQARKTQIAVQIVAKFPEKLKFQSLKCEIRYSPQSQKPRFAVQTSLQIAALNPSFPIAHLRDPVLAPNQPPPKLLSRTVCAGNGECVLLIWTPLRCFSTVLDGGCLCLHARGGSSCRCLRSCWTVLGTDGPYLALIWRHWC